jgi:preprotein translocase subunit SecE
MSAEKTIGEKDTGRRRRRRQEEAEVPETDIETEDEEGDESEDDSKAITPSKGRATPSRRSQVEDVDQGNFLTRTLNTVREYFGGVRSELGKVAWPTREETQRLTVIVLTTTILFSLALGGVGFVFGELFRIGLGAPVLLLGFMVVAVGGGIIWWRVRGNKQNTTY